jgi:hypothetical protein
VAGSQDGSLLIAGNFNTNEGAAWPAWGRRDELSLLETTAKMEPTVWYGERTVEEGGEGLSNCYPSMVQLDERIALVGYSVYETNVPRIGIAVRDVEIGGERGAGGLGGGKFIVFFVVCVTLVAFFAYGWYTTKADRRGGGLLGEEQERSDAKKRGGRV